MSARHTKQPPSQPEQPLLLGSQVEYVSGDSARLSKEVFAVHGVPEGLQGRVTGLSSQFGFTVHGILVRQLEANCLGTGLLNTGAEGTDHVVRAVVPNLRQHSAPLTMNSLQGQFRTYVAPVRATPGTPPNGSSPTAARNRRVQNCAILVVAARDRSEDKPDQAMGFQDWVLCASCCVLLLVGMPCLRSHDRSIGSNQDIIIGPVPIPTAT